MPLSPAVIDALIAAGCTVQQLAAAMKASMLEIEEEEASRRESDRQRKRRQRDRKTEDKSTVASDVSRGNTVTVRDGADIPSLSDKERSPTPSKEINSSTHLSLSPNLFDESGEVERNSTTSKASLLSPGRARSDWWIEFWSMYPNKVGKPAADRAFDKAAQRTDRQTMMAGLIAYVQKNDDRPWCNPATWLNQDRWNDRPAQRAIPPPRRLTRAEELQEELRQRIIDEQNEQDPASGADLEVDERFPRLALQYHGGRD